jgi:hypothetical protein
VEGYRGLLTPAAKQMAIHLLQEPHFLPLTLDAFHFITGFLKKVSCILILVEELTG